MIVFDFTAQSALTHWQIVNDGVMGGISRSSFTLNEERNAVFSGFVSLENSGGFCSVKLGFDEKSLQDCSKAILRLKGDRKRYQFRIKSKRSEYHSFVAYFETSGEWESIIINLGEMYPSFRGRKLDMPNFSGQSIEEIALLIGNRKEENFKLEISRIEFQ